jgi:hypothetical protein
LKAGSQSAPSTGAPKKVGAQALTVLAAIVFQDITGTPPTRSTDWNTNQPNSPFHNFLKRLFAITGVKASPDEQIRAMMAKLKAGGRSSPMGKNE